MTVTEAQQTEVEIQNNQLPPETEETALLEFTDDKQFTGRKYPKRNLKRLVFFYTSMPVRKYLLTEFR